MCPALRLSFGPGTRAGLLNRAVDFVALANALHLAAPRWVADARIVTALRKRTGQRRGGPHGRRWTGARGTNGRHFVRQRAPRPHFAVATAANAAGIGCFGNKAQKRHTQSEQNQSASSAKEMAHANRQLVYDGHFGQPAGSPSAAFSLVKYLGELVSEILHRWKNSEDRSAAVRQHIDIDAPCRFVIACLYPNLGTARITRRNQMIIDVWIVCLRPRIGANLDAGLSKRIQMAPRHAERRNPALLRNGGASR